MEKVQASRTTRRTWRIGHKPEGLCANSPRPFLFSTEDTRALDAPHRQRGAVGPPRTVFSWVVGCGESAPVGPARAGGGRARRGLTEPRGLRSGHALAAAGLARCYRCPLDWPDGPERPVCGKEEAQLRPGNTNTRPRPLCLFGHFLDFGHYGELGTRYRRPAFRSSDSVL
nr:unnamed protein product [Digitaria exilis]